MGNTRDAVRSTFDSKVWELVALVIILASAALVGKLGVWVIVAGGAIASLVLVATYILAVRLRDLDRDGQDQWRQSLTERIDSIDAILEQASTDATAQRTRLFEQMAFGNSTTSELQTTVSTLQTGLARLSDESGLPGLTDLQLCEFESTDSSIERVTVCKKEMGTEFEPREDHRDSAQPFGETVKDNLKQGIHYTWVAASGDVTTARINYLRNELGASEKVQVHEFPIQIWNSLPFSFETTFYELSLPDGTTQVRCYVLLNATTDRGGRIWYPLVGKVRDEWWGGLSAAIETLPPPER